MKSDLQLKKDVTSELEWDPAVDAAVVGVEVKAGIVTLAGRVASYPAKLAAEHAAQRVSGVKGLAVELEVEVPGISQRSDADIAAAASNSLKWNALVPKDRVKVMVENGWVTLSGTVDWSFEKSAAESAVRNLLSVRGVTNLVGIKPRASASNVKVRIEAALQRSAHLDSEAIRVSVDGDKITLDGRVHSHTERRLAEDTAWAAPGVATVVDRLTIVD